MEKKIEYDISLSHFIDYFTLFENIIIYHRKLYDKMSGNTIISQYGICYEKEAQEQDFLSKEFKSQLSNNIFIVPKTLLHFYENTGFGLDKRIVNDEEIPTFEELVKKIYKFEDAFNLFKSGDLTSDDVALISYDPCKCIFFNYDGSWLPHYEKFSSYLYMCTNGDYDLEGLYRFLKSKEDVIVVNDGVQDIPYYNISEDEAKYVNFYIKVNNESESIRYMGELTKYRLEIEKFKIKEKKQ